MALLKILTYPDPMLKRPCDVVKSTGFTDDLRMFVEDMQETMLAAHGAGLAAPQVGRNIRLFIIGRIEDRLDPLIVFVNPKITSSSKATQRAAEGCLSLPGLREHVTRAKDIHVVAQDARGQSFEMDASGFLSVAIQHEFDHLNGVLMLDRLSPMVRKLAVNRLT